MRRDSTIHYATAVTQYERIQGGQPWANPEFALAIHGNVGTTIANVLHTDREDFPFGPDYTWGFKHGDHIPEYDHDANEHHRRPHGLRFSGFNIDDVGITNDCIVTNFHIHLEYTDDSVQDGFSTIQLNKANGSNWLAIVVKGNGQILHRKRFDGIATDVSYVTKERIHCHRDQSWGSNTYGDDIGPNSVEQDQRDVPAEPDVFINPDNYPDHWHYRREYHESTRDIKTMTVGDINDPGFYIDIWYAKFRRYSGIVKLKSVGISIEWIKPYRKNLALWPITTGQNRCKSIYRRDRHSLGWFTADQAMSFDTQDFQPDSYTYIDIYSKRKHNSLVKPFDPYDSDVLLGRLPALADMDDSQESISDMITNFRLNDLHDEIPGHSGLHRTFMKHLTVNWSYTLYNGYPLDREGDTSYGTPIWSHKIELFEPGIKRDFSLTGQDWLNITGGYNTKHRQYYGREDWPRGWYTKHHPIRRYDPDFALESINSSYYPGMVYDPLWIEKAMKVGNLFIGISLTTDIRPNDYYRPIQHYWHNLRWRFKIKGLGIRVKYNNVEPPLVTGPSGPVPPPNSNLIIRFV